MERFISGEQKKIFRVSSHTLLIGLTVSGKYAWQEEEIKKRFQYCTDASGTIVYFRALEGHSGRNLIDPSLQDNVIIQSNFFQYIYHVGCAFNLHSIISSGSIPGGQSSSKRQTVFFLPVDPMDKSHKDPDVIDLSVPRHAHYLHKAWKRHQDAVYWVDINLAIKKELTFYQTRSNAIILQETLPAYCIPKVVRTETGEVLYEKVYMSRRPPPKISLKHEWKRELGSEHAQRSEGGQLSGSFQSNQPILNPIRERTGRPVIRDDLSTVQDERKTSRSQEIDVNSFHEEPVSSERTGTPVIETSVIQARSSEDRKDFNVEQAHERTRRLVSVTNTENVPDSSQTRSVHESETFNVGDKTLRERTVRPVVDHDNLSHEKIMVGNIELCELLETESKTQCTASLSYWNIGIVYCACGHFLQKETAVNRKFVKFSMDLLSVPEYVIKKGRAHGHRYGKKPGDKEYYLVNQIKKKCKRRQFLGIHDRLLRDHEFRIRMIEHHRDEEVCRRWDALADEDHTHHLTEQEYFYYKNKWWLHSNKQGSNTMPLRNRSDFKQALSTL